MRPARFLHTVCATCPGRFDIPQALGAAGFGLDLRVIELGFVARHIDEIRLAVLEPLDIAATGTVAIDNSVAIYQAMVRAEVDGVGRRINDACGTRIENQLLGVFGAVLRSARCRLCQYVQYMVRIGGQVDGCCIQHLGIAAD